MRSLACVVFLVAPLFLTACANQMESSVNPSFETAQIEVDRIAVTGAGATLASPAFSEAGYDVIDLGASRGAPLDRARELGILFIAIVDPTDSDGAWWDGFFSFAMRVSETLTRRVVWSATADYGQGGIFINQAKSTKQAMKDMVKDFAKSFPPKSREPRQEETKERHQDEDAKSKELAI